MNRNKFYNQFYVFVIGAAFILFSENLTASPPSIFSFVQTEDGKMFSQTNSPKKKKEKRKAKSKQKMIETNSAGLSPGIWGGKGIGLTIEENGVKIEFDCADGEIEKNITLDKNGNFTATGVYIASRGGPVRLDSLLERQPARYEGKVSGNRMMLKVTTGETNEPVGEYVLESNKFPIINRCL